MAQQKIYIPAIVIPIIAQNFIPLLRMQDFFYLFCNASAYEGLIVIPDLIGNPEKQCWIPASRLGEALRRSLVAGMTALKSTIYPHNSYETNRRWYDCLG